MIIRIFTFILCFILLHGVAYAEDEVRVVDIKKKYIDAEETAEKEQLLAQLIESYTTIDIDSALFYSDIYRSSFLSNDKNSNLSYPKKYECNYYRLLSQIYKSQHNLILYLEQSKRAHECYSSLDSKEEIAQALVEIGIANGYQGRISEAAASFQDAKDLYIDLLDSLKAAQCSMHLGTTLMMSGDKVSGLESYLEVLEYFEKVGHEEELGKLCNNIGLAHIDLAANDDALNYFQKALGYSEKTGNKFISSQILANIAGCYRENSEYQISLGYLSKGLKLAEEINSDYSKSIFLYEIASTKNKLGKNYEALDAINSSLYIVKDMNNVDQIAKSLLIKSKILLDLSNFHQAHNACKECYEISKHTETLTVQKIALECIQRTANALKIYREAYEYQKEYITISDSLQEINAKEKLTALDKENHYQKEKAILEQKNLLNEALLREEKTSTKIFALLSLLSLLGFGLLGFIFMSNRRYTSRIKEKNSVIESTNEELSKLNKDLENANTKLNNFTSVAAHDLKSPIRTMASYSQLLLMRNKDKFEEKDREMLNFVSSNARRLTTMIDDLLSFSKINDDLGPSEDVNVQNIVEIIQSNLQSSLKENNASIKVLSYLDNVKAHKSLLTQLFQNLIANGIKFKREGVNPVITINKVKQDEETITYSIADNGIGIAPEYHEKIFTIFQRLHNNNDFEGSGIGLSTCKSIVDFYGQEIWLESEPGKGTTFFFRLPRR